MNYTIRCNTRYDVVWKAVNCINRHELVTWPFHGPIWYHFSLACISSVCSSPTKHVQYLITHFIFTITVEWGRLGFLSVPLEFYGASDLFKDVLKWFWIPKSQDNAKKMGTTDHHCHVTRNGMINGPRSDNCAASPFHEVVLLATIRHAS